MKKLLAPLAGLLMLALVAPAHAGTPVERRAAVPWDEVGDGWVLTTIYRGPGEEAPARARSLELISPEGTRYSLYATRRQPERNHVDPSNFTLIGWDPDTRVALLKRYVSLHRTQAIRLDLQSGASQALALPRRESATGLRPDGTGVLTQNLGGKILSIAWDGTRTLLGEGESSRGPITTPDGTAFVIAETGHVTVLPLDGSGASKEIATPGACRPLRWYDDTQLLATCFSRQGSQLVTVGLDGMVTPRAGLRATGPDFRGPSWDESDMRVVGGRAYYEGNGPCGGSFIARENAAGDAKMVRVPGSLGGISLVDARDDRLVIAHTTSCEEGTPRAVLSLFDPVSRDEDVLVTLGKREHWGHVLAWDEARPWGW